MSSQVLRGAGGWSAATGVSAQVAAAMAVAMVAAMAGCEPAAAPGVRASAPATESASIQATARPSTQASANASASTAPRVSASTAASAAPPPCVPSALRDGEIADVARDPAGAVILCLRPQFQDEQRICVKETSVGGSWEAVRYERPVPPPPPPPPYSMATKKDGVEICKAGGACKTVKLGFDVRPGHSEYEGTVNDEGNRLFVYHWKGPKSSTTVATHQSVGELWDVAAGKRIKEFKLPIGSPTSPGVFADPSNRWAARWVGERLILGSWLCCGPAGWEVSLEPGTGRWIDIGDPVLFRELDKDRYLVGTEESRFDEKKGEAYGLVTVNVIDLKSGKTTTARLPNSPREVPETQALGAMREADGSFTIGFTNPPGLVRFDPKSGALGAVRRAPICGG
jgi:hypothetical protein